MDDRRISYSWGNFSSIDRAEGSVFDGDPSNGDTRARVADPGLTTDGPAAPASPNEKDTTTAKTAGGDEATERPSRRSGRRFARIRDVENLGAAAAASQSGRTAARRDEQPDSASPTPGAPELQQIAEHQELGSLRPIELDPVETSGGDKDRTDDARAEADAAADGDRKRNAAPAVAEDDTVVDDPTPSFETMSESLIDSGFSSAALDPDPALEIAEFDESSGDGLDLAEFVIQAAVSGEEDADEHPVSARHTEFGAFESFETGAGAATPSDPADGPEAASGREAADDDSNPLMAFGYSAADDDTGGDTAPDRPAADGLAAATAARRAADDDAAEARSTRDDRHHYGSADLRIPMIDEDDIPSVEAAYEYEAVRQVSDASELGGDGSDPEVSLAVDSLPSAADSGVHRTVLADRHLDTSDETEPETAVQALVDEEERTADPVDDGLTIPAAALAAEHADGEAGDDTPDHGASDHIALDDTALDGTGSDRHTDSQPDRQDSFDTLAVRPISSERTAAASRDDTQIRKPSAPATPDNLAATDAGYGNKSKQGRTTTPMAGEGAHDVKAGRLFSALSLKRLTVPPHVFEARQRVNILSGLAIIGALGFVGWYFSSPMSMERTRLVEASKPKPTGLALQKKPDPVRPVQAVSAAGPKTGLIYQPLKTVEPAALLAIGNLEYRITPSKFHRVVRVVKGDTFISVLVKAGVDRTEAAQAIRSMRSIYDPRKLRIGREIKVAFGVAGAEQTRFLGYNFDSAFDRSVHVARQQSGEFAAAEVKKRVNESYSKVDATITTSLFGSGVQAGAPAQTMVQMISLFSFAVDFQRDLRGGERFQILFRSHKDDSGRVVRTGEIVYASLTVRGRTYDLYRFESKKDGRAEYLNGKGEGNRKALMKTPIDGARLTSNFGYRRHPILGFSKLHTGADFGARTGTPIYAAGDGTIEKIGWYGGYGRYIRIRHGKVYQTAYAHMSRFRSGLKVGARVKQGETIGYVGTTGRSTGPHLHYEVLKSGKFVNPMTITLPSRKRMQGRNLRRFLAFKKQIDERFAKMKDEKQRREEGRVQTVRSDGDDGGEGCKNGIRINPLDKRPCE